MVGLPTVELLEQMHQFPCSYMFKVIGRVEAGFAARVVATVRRELAVEADPPYRTRETAGGRHVAVTLEPTVASAEQVLAVYRRLGAEVGVMYLW